MEEVYDVLILGGGPAGLTAAIYTGRYNLKTLVVASSFGGTANLAGEVENWPGFMGSGRDLMRTVFDQAKRFGTEFLEADIDSVVKDGDNFVLKYGVGEVRGKSLIIALGTEHRQLGISGEKEFLGKGVSYCATCDGNFFKGKDVVVIGGADSAAKASLYLADICNKVVIVYRKGKLRSESVLAERVEGNKKIEIVYDAVPVEVLGEGVVKGLKIEKVKGKGQKVEEVLDVDGVFIEAGAVPVTEILKDIGVEMENGYIVTGKDAKTNVEGVFAAGDVTTVAMRQMIVAAGEGAVAAKSAHEYLLNISAGAKIVG